MPASTGPPEMASKQRGDTLGHEIDFLPVGENSAGGDAIALRWGDLSKSATSLDRYVVVIDGGHADTGDRLAEHIHRWYETSYVDLMVSTHPDNDHIRGLIAIMERDDITVARLWTHKPWEHNSKAALARLIVNYGKADTRTFEEYIANAKKLHDLAIEKGVPVTEPFAGLSLGWRSGSLTVVGPTEDYYKGLVPGFGSRATAPDLARSIKALLQGSAKVLTRAKEDLWTETLTDAGSTSAARGWRGLAAASAFVIFRGLPFGRRRRLGWCLLSSCCSCGRGR